MVKRIFAVLLAVVFIALPAFGQSKSQLMGLGMSAELATKLTGASVPSSQIPLTDNVYDLGSSTKEWKDLYVDGTANLDTAVIDLCTPTAFSTTLKSDTDNTDDLGTSTVEWKDLFIDGTAKVDTLTVDESATVATTLGVTGKITATGSVVYPAALMETKVAAGANQGNSTALTAGKFIHMITAADDTKGVVLPACAAANIGELHFVMNTVADVFLNIWPATDGNINGLGANAVYAAGGAQGKGRGTTLCVCQAANVWYCG